MKKFRDIKLRYKVGSGIAGAAMIAAGGGAAFAYFTSTGSGTGSATVGTSTHWNVSVSNATGGPLYPGAGTESLAYTITNASTGNQAITSTTPSVAADANGYITHTAGTTVTSVTGCKASWFTVTDPNPPTTMANPTRDLAGGASYSGSLTVTMQDSGTAQDACQGALPDITLAVN